MPDNTPIVDALLRSVEPSVRYRVRTGVLGEENTSPSIRALRAAIRESPRVRALLARRNADGRIPPFHHTYRKWAGAHWVFAALADIGYPPGDRTLIPLRDQVFEFWLRPDRGTNVVEGRVRVCASLEAKRLPAGGWAAEARFYRVTRGEPTGGCDVIAWGVTSRTRMNEWVTADALAVLAAADRL